MGKKSFPANKRISKRLIFSMVTFGFTIAVCFVLLEYGLGRFYYSNDNQIPSKVFDPILGWRLRPGTYWIKPAHTFRKHSFHINRFGLRNREITVMVEEDRNRILILGDSFTYAQKVRDQYIFSTQLEILLNEGNPNKYEVINAGVPGYGTAQELLLMRKLTAQNVTGDIYLLMVFINDVLDNLRLSYADLTETPAQPGFVLHSDAYNSELELRYLPKKEHSANLVPLNRTPPRFVIPQVLKGRIQTYLQTKPSLVQLLNKLGINAKFPRIPGLLNGWYRKEILSSGIPLTQALIGEIKNEALSKNAKLLISLIPSPIQVYPDIYNPILKRTFPNNGLVDAYLKDVTKPQKTIKAICEELDIPFLDLYPVLWQSNDRELFIPADGHLTETGHKVVADNLAVFIMRNTERNSLQADM